MLSHHQQTLRLNTEAMELRTLRARRKPENFFRRRNLPLISPLGLCALCVLCGEMFLVLRAGRPGLCMLN